MIKFSIGADTTDFDKNVKSTEKKLVELKKEMRDGISTSAKWGAGMAAAAMATATAMAVQGAKAVSSQVDLQRSIGGTYDALTSLKLAAKDMGLEGLDASLTRMNRRLGAAESGAGSAAGVVKELGLDLRELSKLDADQKIAHISDKMREMNVTSERAARLAQDLGFEQTQAARFFMEGGDAIMSYRAEVEALGMSISDVDAMRVANANDSMAKMSVILGSIGEQMAVHVAPVVEALGRMFSDAAKEAGGIGNAVGKGANIAVKAIGFAMDAVEGFKRTFEIAGKAIAVYMLSVKAAVMTVAQAIINHPVNAINLLIDTANKLPGINIDNVSLTGFGQSMKDQAELARGAVKTGLLDIHETLMKPLPSNQFNEFVADAKIASDEAAQSAIDAQAKMKAAFSGGEGGQGESEETKKKKEDLAARLEAIREANLEEMALLLEKQEAEMEAIALGREMLIAQGIDYDALELETAQRHQAAITDIEKRESDERKRQAKEEAEFKQKILGGALNAMTTLMNSGSKKMFQIGKAAAISQALIATFQGAAEALKLGFPMGPIAATAVASAGMVQVQNIKKQTMGGGGSGSTGAGGAVNTPTQQVNAASEPVMQRNINIDIAGESVSKDQVRSLIGSINTELGDGVKMGMT